LPSIQNPKWLILSCYYPARSFGFRSLWAGYLHHHRPDHDVKLTQSAAIPGSLPWVGAYLSYPDELRGRYPCTCLLTLSGRQDPALYQIFTLETRLDSH
jgi:hypothetical protein